MAMELVVDKDTEEQEQEREAELVSWSSLVFKVFYTVFYNTQQDSGLEWMLVLALVQMEVLMEAVNGAQQKTQLLLNSISIFFFF